jgi:hypothetical protein
MNAYITFDGLKYRTSHKTWKVAIQPMANSRILADGTLDVTHGPTTAYLFTGELMADVTPDTGFGSVVQLRISLAKKQAFTFIDHYGSTYTIHAIGPFPERSLSPKWDSSSNIFYVTIQFKGIKIA